MSVALIVLAAGQGTRMNSDLPKMLQPLAGAPLVVHAVRAGRAIEPERTVVVVGHEAERVRAALRDYDDTIATAIQTEQKGTGHAVAQALPALDGFTGRVVVLFGDTPFVTPDTLARLVASTADVAILQLQPEAQQRLLRVVGEARNQEAMFEYLRRLERTEPLWNVHLVSHQVQLEDPQRSVQFSLQAAFREAP